MKDHITMAHDMVLEEEAALLEGTEGSQVMGSKCKEVTARDEEGQWPSKKAREKYHGGAAIKMGGANPCKRCVCTPQCYELKPLCCSNHSSLKDK